MFNIVETFDDHFVVVCYNTINTGRLYIALLLIYLSFFLCRNAPSACNGHCVLDRLDTKVWMLLSI